MVNNEGFPYIQNIETEFGKIRIGVLYNMYKANKVLPKVKSFNNSQDFEYKNIKCIHNFGEQNLIQINCGNRKILCTENVGFLTNKGIINADNLIEGDLIKTTPPETHQILRSVNKDQEQIVLGSFLGDGHLSNHGKNRYRLEVIHSIQQEDYCKWKADMFQCDVKLIEHNGYSQKSALKFCSKMIGIENNFPKSKTTCPQWILDKLDAKGIAIWFMDDGSSSSSNGINATISTCSFDEDSQIKFVEKFKSLGIDCYYKFQNMTGVRAPGYFSIYFKRNGFIELCKLISPFIHKNLYYKLHKSTNIIKSYNWDKKFNNYGLTVVDNIIRSNKRDIIYNLEVEDNYNFIITSQSKVNGGLVTYG